MAETLADNDLKEHYIKRGNPKKPTYYIIRRGGKGTGLFYRFIQNAGHVHYALSKGWLPVVDMQNYPSPYLAPEKFGKENAWEYYFEQPLRIGLEQAYSGENIILSYASDFSPCPHNGMHFLENKDGTLTRWKNLIKLGLLKIKFSLLEEILSVREKLFAPNDRVLGVLLRGTDYVAKRPQWHPIPPPIEFAISTVIMKINEWKCNKIFLATEDKNIVQIFKQVFGNLCVTFNREYVDYKQGEFIANMHIDRPDDHFIQGKDYLTQMVIASMCNSFVVARCSGSVGVMLMADKFEHTYFFNLGRYGIIGFD